MTNELQVRADDSAAYDLYRNAYLAQLVLPMDDMWGAFADQAQHYALCVGDETVGCAAVDDERRLLRFYVRPASSLHASEFMTLVRDELEVEYMMVSTADPCALSWAVDSSSKVESHSLLFEWGSKPNGADLEPLRLGTAEDAESIVDFQAAAIGAPRNFLESYVATRLSRREMLLHELKGELVCVGELRVDEQQEGVAHLGLIVAESRRGQGVGSRMLSSLVSRGRAKGLAPQCSTELANQAARRAIERVGFRANNRLLRVEF